MDFLLRGGAEVSSQFLVADPLAMDGLLLRGGAEVLGRLCQRTTARYLYSVLGRSDVIDCIGNCARNRWIVEKNTLKGWKKGVRNDAWQADYFMRWME